MHRDWGATESLTNSDETPKPPQHTMSVKSFAIGLATPSYLSEQFSSLSNTMEENIRTLINNGSATSEVEFDEEDDVPYIFDPRDGGKVQFSEISLEGDEIKVYDASHDLIDKLDYIDYDSQLLIYTAVYDKLAREN